AFTTSFTIASSLFNISTPTTLSDLSPRTSLYLTSSLTISGSVTCQSITIAPGGFLEILPGSTLHVYGELDNQVDTSGLIIRSDASASGSLIQSCSDVQATVERYIGPNQWHFVASPVTDPGSVDELFGNEANHLYGIYYYDEALGQWASAAGSNMNAGKGYDVFYSDEGRTVSFRGTLNNFRNRGWLQVTRGSGAGWNLLGNPFPCSINWGVTDMADAPGWKNQATVLEHKTIYITTGGSGDGTTFATYNGSSGVGVPDNQVGIITSGQGFWLRAAGDGEIGVGSYAQSLVSSTFKIARVPEQENNGTGEHENRRMGVPCALVPLSPCAPNSTYPNNSVESTKVNLHENREYFLLDQGGTQPLPIFRFSVTSLTTGHSDQVALVFDERSVTGIDRFDSPKLKGNGLQMHLKSEGQSLVIESRPFPAADSDSLELSMEIPKTGEYEINMTSCIDSTFSHPNPSATNDISSLSFILEDRLTGVKHIFRDHPVYAFSAGAGVLEGRFVVKYSIVEDMDMWNGGNVEDSVSWEIGRQADRLVISFLQEPGWNPEIRIIDTMGKEVAKYPVNASSRQMMIPRPAVTGILLAQLRSSSGCSTIKFLND
ncbi:MAG: hypothetical protein PHD25_12410, partial [Bacteroidales bacterium]|nr:hypothetical protein [Bacteroidales bacterium]